jgi:hypothetical protein
MRALAPEALLYRPVKTFSAAFSPCGTIFLSVRLGAAFGSPTWNRTLPLLHSIENHEHAAMMMTREQSVSFVKTRRSEPAPSRDKPYLNYL